MKDKIYTREQTIAMLEVMAEFVALKNDDDKYAHVECALYHAIDYLKEK